MHQSLQRGVLEEKAEWELVVPCERSARRRANSSAGGKWQRGQTELRNRFIDLSPRERLGAIGCYVLMWELFNKIMRIGLHGLCRYIKLERGGTGGAEGADQAQARAPGYGGAT